MAELSELGITPRTKTTSAPAPSEPSTSKSPTDVFPNLPQEVKGVPLVEWLAVGEPPAVRIESGQYFPELEPLGKHLPEVIKGGLDVYKAQSGDTVFFNPLFISEQELQVADQEGTLPQAVPSYSELSGSKPQQMTPEKFDELLNQSEDLQIRLKELSTPGDEVEEPEPAAEPSAIPQSPAMLQNNLAAQRARQLIPGAPTSGPSPGAGRLLSGILKKAI